MKRRIDFLAKPFPTIDEFIFLTAVVLIVTIFITFIDITIHENYVKLIISECWWNSPTDFKDTEFCNTARDTLNDKWWVDYNKPKEAQKLGGIYWSVLNTVPLTFAVLFGGGRIVFGWLAGAKITPMLFIIGILWGASILVLYDHGFIDYFYYALRGLPIPEVLPWLDNSGGFVYLKHLGATNSVDDTDLYTLMGIGVIGYIGVWAFMIHHHNKGTWRRLGLI